MIMEDTGHDHLPEPSAAPSVDKEVQESIQWLNGRVDEAARIPVSLKTGDSKIKTLERLIREIDDDLEVTSIAARKENMQSAKIKLEDALKTTRRELSGLRSDTHAPY